MGKGKRTIIVGDKNGNKTGASGSLQIKPSFRLYYCCVSTAEWSRSKSAKAGSWCEIPGTPAETGG
jgi:hypothetical protein